MALDALVELSLSFEHRAELLGRAGHFGRFVILPFGSGLILETLELGQDSGHRGGGGRSCGCAEIIRHHAMKKLVIGF